MRLFLAMLLAATAAGCASRPSREQLAAADDSSCQSYGHRYGTTSYAQCREGRDAMRFVQDQRRASALSNAANSIDFKPIVPGQNQTRCVSRPSYGIITTVCD